MDAMALRLDDVGAASKQHEVYGITRIPFGPIALESRANTWYGSGGSGSSRCWSRERAKR